MIARARAVRWMFLVGALASAACTGDASGPVLPSTPAGVTVTLTSLTSVRVDWTANPAREAVKSYAVLRNGAKVADVTVPTYTDFGLEELRTYTYTVVAQGSGSAQSSPSPVTTQSTFTLPDLTGPTVVSSVPATSATNVAISTPITVTVSESLDASTVTNANLVLRAVGSTQDVAGAVSYASGAKAFTFTPSVPLTPSTAYTFDITTALKDAAGNRLLVAYRASFTTAAPIDATPPTVLAFAPVTGAVDVPVRAAVTATFSEAMNAASISATSMTLAPTAGGANVAATVSYAAGTRTATLAPIAPLVASTSYTARITTAATDLAGNGLASVAITQFVTSAPVDESAPTVTAVTPANGAVDVPLASVMSVTFSEAMSTATVTASTLTLTRAPGAVAVPAVVEFSPATNRATLTPSAPLTLGATYTLTVTTGARDLSGNPLAVPFTSQFTAIGADVVPPTVTATFPANGAANIDPASTLTATFSETMNAASLTAAAFVLRTTSGGTAVAGAVSYNVATRTLSLVPTARLAGNTGYTATVTTAARDSAGNAMAAARDFNFTTAATSDDTPPRIASSVPTADAGAIDITTAISVRFNETMNAATLTTAAITLRVANTTELLAGALSYDAATTTLTFRPAAPLEYVTTYTVSVGGIARDLAGNRLEATSFSFQTRPAPSRIVSFTPADRSVDVDANAPMLVTFSLPMIASSINSSTFFLRNRTTAALVPGVVSYNPATLTASFAPSTALNNNNGYVITMTAGVTDVNGQSLQAQQEHCFTPAPGTVAPVTMTGFWSAGSACGEIHWHLTLVQTGNTIALVSPSACAAVPGDCQLSALDANGLIALGGRSVVAVTSVTGTVNGNTVAFTITTANGLTFAFTGAFAANPSGQPNSWIIGRISGATLPAVGITFEKQRP